MAQEDLWEMAAARTEEGFTLVQVVVVAEDLVLSQMAQQIWGTMVAVALLAWQAVAVAAAAVVGGAQGLAPSL